VNFLVLLLEVARSLCDDDGEHDERADRFRDDVREHDEHSFVHVFVCDETIRKKNGPLEETCRQSESQANSLEKIDDPLFPIGDLLKDEIEKPTAKDQEENADQQRVNDDEDNVAVVEVRFFGCAWRYLLVLSDPKVY